MKPFLALLTCMLPLAASPVHASPELASKSHCMGCHHAEQARLGPSFKAIATKYKLGLGCEKEDATAMLTESILHGSKGKWGKVPMPGQKIPAEDAKTLAVWILGC